MDEDLGRAGRIYLMMGTMMMGERSSMRVYMYMTVNCMVIMELLIQSHEECGNTKKLKNV